VDYLRGSKVEFPDIGFGFLSNTLVFSIVGQQWQSYSGLVHSIPIMKNCYEESLIVCANVVNGCGTQLVLPSECEQSCCAHLEVPGFFKEHVWDVFLLKISSSDCLLLM
jgi:hypothetical protein